MSSLPIPLCCVCNRISPDGPSPPDLWAHDERGHSQQWRAMAFSNRSLLILCLLQEARSKGCLLPPLLRGAPTTGLMAMAYNCTSDALLALQLYLFDQVPGAPLTMSLGDGLGAGVPWSAHAIQRIYGWPGLMPTGLGHAGPSLPPRPPPPRASTYHPPRIAAAGPLPPTPARLFSLRWSGFQGFLKFNARDLIPQLAVLIYLAGLARTPYTLLGWYFTGYRVPHYRPAPLETPAPLAPPLAAAAAAT